MLTHDPPQDPFQEKYKTTQSPTLDNGGVWVSVRYTFLAFRTAYPHTAPAYLATGLLLKKTVTLSCSSATVEWPTLFCEVVDTRVKVSAPEHLVEVAVKRSLLLDHRVEENKCYACSPFSNAQARIMISVNYAPVVSDRRRSVSLSLTCICFQ